MIFSGKCLRGRSPGESSSPGRWTLGIFSAGVLFLGLIQIFTVALSLAGGVVSRRSALAIIALAGLGALVYFRGFVPRAGAIQSPEGRSEGFPRSLKLLFFPALLVYVSLWLLAYALPDLSYDGLWFHIPTLHFWSLAGKIQWIAADLPSVWDSLINNNLNGFPKGVELITFVLVRATGLARLANSVNLPFLPVGVFSLIVISRLLGATRTFSVLSGVLFVFIPVNIAQSTTAYVDTATASVYLSCLALLSVTLVRIRRGELGWRYLPALGAAAGLATAAKSPGIIFPPLIAVLLAAVFFPRSIRKCFPGGGLSLRGPVFILSFLLIAVLVGGYWPIRNYVRTGNPINPVGVELAGRVIFPDRSWPGQFDPPYPEGTEDWSQASRVFSYWISNFTDWWPVTTYCDWYHRGGGLGRLWMFGALPALAGLAAAELIRRLQGRRGPPVISDPGVFLVLILIVVLLFFLMPPHHNHLARYTIWLYGLGLPAFVLAGQRAWNCRSRPLRWGGRFWMIGVIGLLTAEGSASLLYQYDLTRQYWDDWRRPPPIGLRLCRSLSYPYPSGFPAGSLAAAMITGGGAAALGPLDGRKVLILGRLAEGPAFGTRKIYFLDPGIAEDRARLSAYLADRDIRFVVWDEEIEVPRPLRELSVLRESAPGGLFVLAFHPQLQKFTGTSP